MKVQILAFFLFLTSALAVLHTTTVTATHANGKTYTITRTLGREVTRTTVTQTQTIVGKGGKTFTRTQTRTRIARPTGGNGGGSGGNGGNCGNKPLAACTANSGTCPCIFSDVNGIEVDGVCGLTVLNVPVCNPLS